MLEKYRKLSLNGRCFFWLLILCAVVYLAMLPLYFFGVNKGYSYPNGWLFGSIFMLAVYYSFIKMGDFLISKERNNTGLGVAISFIRPIVYLLVLGVSAICTFKSDWFGGFDAFNFYTSFAALLILPIVMWIVHMIDAARSKKETENKE